MVCKKKTGKIIGGVLLAGVACAIGFGAAGTVCMVRAAYQMPKGETVMIVLGCGVNGETPSLMLSERLSAAYTYLSEHDDVVCILSGGQGPGEDISEAECMYRYLTENGISADRLYKEDRSTSTRENLAFSYELIGEKKLPTEVILVTNEFHEYRAAMIAKENGLHPSAVCGQTAWWLLPTYYIRELYGIIYEWLL